MNKRIRIVIVLSVLTVAGAFLGATPLFFEQQASTTTSTFKIDMSYKSVATNDNMVRVQTFSQAEQGSFFLQTEEQQGYLLSPLLDTQVDITVTGLIARAVVTQEFSNPTDEWVNGIYAFPLPENAAIDHLSMQIGERKITGQIQPKQKAKRIYQQAKKAGKKASLLVQNRPNLFTNSVANIGPGEKIKVTIEYQQAVKYDNGAFSLRFPTTITERYLPAKRLPDGLIATDQNGWGITQPSFVEDLQKASAEQLVPKNKVAMNINLYTGFSLAAINSDTHPIVKNQIAPGQYNIQLRQTMIANQDFTLTWQPQANSKPMAAHFSQQKGNSHYGMMMLMPPVSDKDTKPLAREVIFVIDTSGSMAGTSMTQAKKALTLAINELADNDIFNIVQFNSSARRLWTDSLIANAGNKKQAIGHIANLYANGGTEILSALQQALGRQDEQSGRLRQVIFITDGAVGNETELFSYIDNNLKHSRLFTVGIGSAPNSYFMTEAAQMGKGSYTYVNSIENVQTQMQTLFTKLTRPVLADLQLSFLQDVEVYPRNLPDLYQGEPLMISYRSDMPLDNVQAAGSLHSQSWQQSLQLQRGGKQSGLDILWARRKIAQLERDKYIGQAAAQINQQILNVAMQHHLVSSMTSLVAVDETPAAPTTSKDKQIKNHRPKGQVKGVLPKTATPAALQLLVAALLMSIALCLSFIARQRKANCVQ